MNELQQYTVIKAPHISEKSSYVASLRQYVFKVDSDATKLTIKSAVEKLFNVKVKSVRVCNVKPKKIVFGRIQGKHKGWKKAYVSLMEGHSLEMSGSGA